MSLVFHTWVLKQLIMEQIFFFKARAVRVSAPNLALIPWTILNNTEKRIEISRQVEVVGHKPKLQFYYANQFKTLHKEEPIYNRKKKSLDLENK